MAINHLIGWLSSLNRHNSWLITVTVFEVRRSWCGFVIVGQGRTGILLPPKKVGGLCGARDFYQRFAQPFYFVVFFINRLEKTFNIWIALAVSHVVLLNNFTPAAIHGAMPIQTIAAWIFNFPEENHYSSPGGGLSALLAVVRNSSPMVARMA